MKAFHNGLVSLAVAWLIGYGLFFYSFTLPNSVPRTSRGQIWMEMPDILALSALPTSDEKPTGWKYLPQRFDLLAVAMAIWAGAWGAGNLTLRLIKAEFSVVSFERFVLAMGVGLSALSLLTLGFGMAGLLSQWLFGATLVLLFAGEVILRRTSGPASREISPEESAREQSTGWRQRLAQGRLTTGGFLTPACLLVMALFLLAMLLGAMLPPTDFDVKEYHLQGPKEFFQQGRITMLPHNVYTSFPFLTEMLSLMAMVLRDDWFRGALAGKAVLMGFAPLSALTVYCAGRRWFSPPAGLLAALILLSTPWTYRISIIAYAEGGLTFYLIASLFAVLLGIERSSYGKPAQRLFLLAGLMAGSAMACKYPGVLQVVIPLGVVVAATPFLAKWEHSNGMQSALRTASFYVVGIVIAVGPWLLKNSMETGNPVYPLMYSIFGGADWNPEMNEKWKAAHSPDNHDLGDLAEKLVDVTAKSDWLSPLLFGLAPLAFLARDRRRLCVGLWCYVVFLFLAWWIFTHRIDRFWVPLIPVVALLAGIAAVWSTHWLWKLACTTAVAAAVLFNLTFITTPFCGYNEYLVDLDHARETITSADQTLAALNRSGLSDADFVLCVGQADVFDATFPVIYNTVFDNSIFEEWCANSPGDTSHSDSGMRPAEEIRRKFSEADVKYVLVNWQEILRYRMTYGYTDFVTPQRFRWLVENGVLGEPVNELQRYSEFSPDSMESQREALAAWAPELEFASGDRRGYIASQVFPVLP